MLLSDGFDYAIQITTDSPQFGGLSGATLEEAKSWCKLKSDAKAVTVYCDATIALPMLVCYLIDSFSEGDV
jgi:deoxyhypusine synthase